MRVLCHSTWLTQFFCWSSFFLSTLTANCSSVILWVAMKTDPYAPDEISLSIRKSDLHGLMCGGGWSQSLIASIQ